MLDVEYSTRFKWDVKSCEKRHYDMKRLKQVVEILRKPETLPPNNFDHALIGKTYVGYRECHVEPDWLLICRYQENKLFLYRTGAHADLFG